MEIKFKRADRDLSVGMVSDIGKDPSLDTIENILLDATTLTLEEIREIGIKEARALYNEIVANSMREGEDDDDESSKKK